GRRNGAAGATHRRRRRTLPRGVAASRLFGCALPRPLGHAHRDPGTRLVALRRRADSRQLRWPASDQVAALPGRGRSAVCVSLGRQGPDAGTATRAASHVRPGRDPGPDQLRASRLMDVFIGDWDRHHDQWRWARFDSGGVRWWRPIPRDRDQAFARLDGVLVWLTGFYWPQVIGFGDDYPSIWRLTYTGQVPDRRLLVDLEKPVWDSVATSLQARLTDSVIAAAVRRLPPEYYQKSGAALDRALRRRRDHLPQISDRYYALLAGVVEIHGTDDRDIAEIERLPGGRVSVRLSARAGGAPFYRRTFHRQETEEIRLYLHGG